MEFVNGLIIVKSKLLDGVTINLSSAPAVIRNLPWVDVPSDKSNTFPSVWTRELTLPIVVSVAPLAVNV